MTCMKKQFSIIMFVLAALLFNSIGVSAKTNDETYDFTFLMGYMKLGSGFPPALEPCVVDNAIISLDYTINEQGEYRFSELTPGEYKYIIKTEGKMNVSGRLAIPEQLMSTEDPSIQTLLAMFQITLDGEYVFRPAIDGYALSGESETFSVTFNIQEETGIEINDAIVSINGTEYASDEVVLEAGIYEYTVSKDGYASETGSMIVVDNNEVVETVMTEAIAPTEYDFTILPAYLDNNSGEIYTITEAVISLNNIINEVNDYSFESIPLGDYKYIISKEGYPTASGRMNIPGHLEKLEEPALSIFQVEGWVFLPDMNTITKMATPGTSDKYAVTFNITDLDENKVEGATIIINGVEYDADDLEIEAGIYDYTVSKNRYKPVSGSMIIVDALETIEVVTEYYGEIDPEYTYEYYVLDDTDDLTLSLISANGEYVGGHYYGKCFIHNTTTKETQIFQRNVQGDIIAGIANDGTCYGSMGELESAVPAYRPWGGEWTALPGAETDTDCAIFSVSTDGKLLGGWSYKENDKRIWRPCLWKQNEDGIYIKEFLPFPETDYTGKEAQGSRVQQFSADNSVIRGIYVPYVGPAEGHVIIWREGNNSYEYEMVGENLIYDPSASSNNSLTIYHTKMSANGKYIVSGIQYYVVDGGSYYLNLSPVLFNIETPGDVTYKIIEDSNYGNANTGTGVYGAAVLDDGFVFGSVPYNSAQFPSSGLACYENSGFIDYADWLKTTTDVDIFDNPNITMSGFPTISGQENLFAGSYSAGPNVNEGVVSYYIKRGIDGGESIDNINSTLKTHAYIYQETLYLKGEIAVVSLFDISGKLVYKGQYQENISISNLSRGIYMVILTLNDGRQEAHKLMKAK